MRFFCHKVQDAATLKPGHYDIVLAVGIVHHLNDNEAAYLFDIAYQTLKLNGALITYDNVYGSKLELVCEMVDFERPRARRTYD